MRSFFCTILLLVGFQVYAFSSGVEGKKFELNCNLAGLKNGVKISLIQYSNKDTVGITKSINGQFSFVGVVPNMTEYYYLHIDSNVSKNRSDEFLLVNGKLLLIGKLSNWPVVRLIGSKPNEEFILLKRIWSEFEFSKMRKDKIREFIKAHTNSVYVSDLIRRVRNDFSYEERLVFYLGLTSTAQASYFGKLLKEELELESKRLKIKDGALVPNLHLVSQKGGQINLLDLVRKSKYTLIDFWASWCKPCQEDFPYLQDVYNAFSDVGFNIVSIAISDKKDNWKKAISKLRPNWHQCIDTTETSFKYFDLQTIPAYILIDSTGRIISFDCNGSQISRIGPGIKKEALKATVDSLLRINSNKVPRKVEQEKRLSPIEIGARIPDVELGKILNHPKLKSAKMSDFYGKYLILDFWSTYCSVCIYKFKELEKLQEKFKDKLTIMPVGFDGFKMGSIEEYIKKTNGTIEEVKLPTCIQSPKDTTLFQLFPFGELPHEVWVDPQGNLIAITDDKAITEENVAAIISGKKLPFRRKIITQKIIDYDQQLFLKADYNNKILLGSAFSNYVDTFSCYTFKYRPSKQYPYNRWGWVNVTMYDLYKMAYEPEIEEIRLDGYYNKRIVLENVSDSIPLDWCDADTKMDNWKFYDFKKNNLFGYELIMSNEYSPNEMNKKMKEDLDAFFGFKSVVEFREMQCYRIDMNINKNQTSSAKFENDKNYQTISVQELPLFLNSQMETKRCFIAGNILNSTKKIFVPRKIVLDKEDIKSVLENNNIILSEFNKEVKVLVLKRVK